MGEGKERSGGDKQKLSLNVVKWGSGKESV